ncbi:aminoglycoside phosphotransferase family protein [Falsiroseomonas sp.]|uniref:aminoglycoside phosphotransferase family protein n=1 Tax=Falsiroseomonas sp. TaxID=2870721 RepID=UPI003561345B
MSPPREIDTALVARLVSDQFPQWSDLTVTPVEPGGWCNCTFRLGADMVARLPRAERYVAQVAKEQRWLPVLASALPLPIPQPLAQGHAGRGYPWSWSVYRWIEGEPAIQARIADLPAFAADVAGFLRALWQADTIGGPAPGAHNFHRGGSLAVYDAETHQALEALGNRIDRPAAAVAWDAALASRQDGRPVWVHGDLSAGNLLVREGRLAAVIDFGNMAVGDPACDLALAWTFLDRQGRRAFLDALAPDAGTLARARGWVLWKALIVLAGLPGTNPAEVETARRVLAEVLDEDGPAGA